MHAGGDDTGQDVTAYDLPCKFADMVVLSDDLLTCPVDKRRDIEALLTVVNGREVFRREQ